MQNSVVLFTFFFVLDHKCPFWANFVQNVKIASLRLNLVTSLIRTSEFNDAVHIFRFQQKMPFLGKFAPNVQYCQFKVKLGTQTNSNMQNSMMLFTFFVCDRKCCFWTNLPKLIRICTCLKRGSQFKLKFGTQTNWNCKASPSRSCGYVNMVQQLALPFVGLQSFTMYLRLTIVFI